MKSATFIILSLLAFCLIVSDQAFAQGNKPCGANYDISSIKDVMVDENNTYISNEIEIVVNTPIDKFFEWSDNTPLEEKTGGAGTKALNNKKENEHGYRRVVCSNDGNTAVEEFIEIIPQKYFSYKLWNWSHEFFSTWFEYAKGEFWYTPMGNKTHIRWRYSFKLKNDNEIIRQRMETDFVKKNWHAWMVWTLNNMKDLAEKSVR